MTKTVDQRFNEKWELDPATGCHMWTKGKDKDGYGKFRIGARNWYAHRYALERKLGRPIASGLTTNHICNGRGKGGNPACVNPAHLEEETRTRNAAEAGRRTGPVNGPRNLAKMQGTHRGGPKLNHVLVAQIRALIARGGQTRAIAAQFGVSERTIAKIKSGRAWAKKP
jgi:hypothetical protein